MKILNEEELLIAPGKTEGMWFAVSFTQRGKEQEMVIRKVFYNKAKCEEHINRENKDKA